MTTLVNNFPVSIPIGESEIGPANLPPATREIRVSYDCSAWPAVADGTLVVTLRISDDGGSNYRDQWSDRFEHVQLMRRGVPVPVAGFSVDLVQPFGNNSKVKVGFSSTVPISTSVSIAAV